MLSYDVGKYVVTARTARLPWTTRSTDEAEDQPIETPTRRRWLGCGRPVLDVTFTPYIVFVNQMATSRTGSAGPVDYKILEREVLRATE